MEKQSRVICDCPAGYGQDHSLYCALVKERRGELDIQEDDIESPVDYPRSAIPEAITLELE